MTSFSTRAETLAAVRTVRDLVDRLPVAGVNELGPVLDATEALSAAVQSIALVDPALAVGTHHYRASRGLAPLDRPN